jgi:hypothetical protein
VTIKSAAVGTLLPDRRARDDQAAQLLSAAAITANAGNHVPTTS